MTTSTTRQTVNKFPGVEGKEQSSLGTLCTAKADNGVLSASNSRKLLVFPG